MRSIRVRALVGAFVAMAALPAVAVAGGDAAAGKAKSLACQACHVGAAADTPHLAGQREVYIARQLKSFKNGDRKNKVMNAIATQLSDADIDNLAAHWGTQPAGSDTTVSPEVAAIRKSPMTFPADFPKGYTLYATTFNEEQKVVNVNYVNAVGLAAAKAGKPLPDGSAIIVGKYTPKLDAKKQPIVENGTWVPDTLKNYVGMEARAGWGKPIPELLRNDNWVYGVFSVDKKPNAELNQAPCLGCHKPLASDSYVFTIKHIKAKAGAK